VLLVSFQVILIVSGNLSFLNWLTIVPCLACFDDTFWARVLPGALAPRALRAGAEAQRSEAQTIVAVALALIIAVLSIDPVVNLISPGQVDEHVLQSFSIS